MLIGSLTILLACLSVQKIWCPLGCLHLPEFLCDRCLVAISLPPTHLLAEESVTLAKQLVAVDPNMATQLVLTRTAFVEIRSLIVHSHLGETVRQELVKTLTDLKDMIAIGAERSSLLTVSFQTTVEQIYSSIQRASDNLQQMSHGPGELITGNKTTERKEIFLLSFARLECNDDEEIL